MGAGSYYRGEIILDNHLFTEAYRPENHFKISRFGEVFKAQPATQLSSQDPEDLDLRLVAEQVAECALSPSDPTAHISPLHLEGDSVSTNLNSPTRPEWQKLCIQYSVCIHNIYGNCAYNNNCYYHHLEDFKKPDLLFKTEMCRYGSDCVNRSRCCFAHSKSEKRTPEHNVRESLAKNRVLSFPAAVFPVNPAMSIHGPASTLTPNRFSSSPTRMEPLHRRHRSPSPSFGSVDAISGHHMGFQSLAPLPLDF